MSQTPITRRLSNSNVVLDRRGRRSASNNFQPGVANQELHIPSPIASESEGTATPPSAPAVFPLQDRIPSLSHTEGSESDHSAAVSTPDGPSRNPRIATPYNAHHGDVRHTPARQINYEEHEEHEHTAEEITAEQSYEETSVANGESLIEPPSLGSLLHADVASPAKTPQSPVYSTPGMGRLDSRHRSPSGMPTPRASGPLTDITTAQNTPMQVPFTPIPAGGSPKLSDVSTPRPPLSDAERRKSHVLAVLNSAAPPSRTFRTFQRTPHPLRRVSMAPATESISENSPLGASSVLLNSLQAPDASFQSGNESFASIASSADLTTDKRASTHRAHMSRGNTSFPNILLPTSNSVASPGGSLRGGYGEHRADGIKIHKHLNAMNKQLLEANGELAREAEAWRAEVDRLLGILEDAGIEYEQVDVEAQIEEGGSLLGDRAAQEQHSGDLSSQVADQSALLSVPRSRRGVSPGERSVVTEGGGTMSTEEHEAVVQEMMERLEMLEEGLDEKDRIIADLEARIETGHEGGELSMNQNEVQELRQQLEELEQDKEALSSEFAAKTEEHARQFGEICTDFEQQVATLEEKLAAADQDIARLKDENDRLLSQARSSTPGSTGRHETALEIELERAKAECQTREQEIEELGRHVESLEDQLKVAQAAADELEDKRARVTELQRQVDADSGKMDELQSDKVELENELAEREGEMRELAERLEQLEADVEANEQDDKAAESELMAEIDRLNSALKDVNDTIAAKDAELESVRARVATRDEQGDAVDVLERHLEDAFREIGRLKQELSAMPHLKSTLEVREAKLQALEREKAALQDRLAGAKERSFSIPHAESPFKLSPFKHRAVTSLRMPNTPGTMPEVSIRNFGLLRADAD